MNIENLILSNLISNEKYARKVLPFLKQDYFLDKEYRVVYDIIDHYIKTYNSIPSKEALAIDLSNRDDLNEDTFKKSKVLLAELDNNFENKDLQWLIDNTETFCKDKALYNAIKKSIEVINNKEENLSRGALPKLLSDALGVSFNTNIGHDFIEDADKRLEYYKMEEDKLPFDLEFMNKITKGGLPRKTLNVILAGTGVGKSLLMCHCAATNYLQGKKVLYITLEMREEEIARRLDANLLNIPIHELETIDESLYKKKLERIKARTAGEIIIKEYPTASAGSANFRYLINELKLKKNFIPDVIYIDYLNICISSRLKSASNVNSYTYVKAIAEELRGLAVEFDVPLITATQTTRSGFVSSDIGLEDTSESFGLPATADFMIALIAAEELVELGQIMIKQLKNRYNDMYLSRRFVVGVDKSRMRFYDVEQNAQDDIQDDSPVMDKSNTGERVKAEDKFDSNKKRRGFK